MKSSPTSMVDKATYGFFVREAGVPNRPSRARDPFEAWIALMEVVEALCPRWPARVHRITGEFKV